MNFYYINKYYKKLNYNFLFYFIINIFLIKNLIITFYFILL